VPLFFARRRRQALEIAVKITTFVLWLLGFVLPLGALAHEPVRCDSCNIEVRSLDEPVKLAGGWLFTRDDSPANANENIDTSQWKVIKAPGPWKHAYGDGRNFEVGWYRGVMHFDPSLVGKDVVLLVNTYMARMEVYVDGKPVFRRPDENNLHRYYSIQPAPVRFTVTKPTEVIAMRVDTPLMTGVYQLPFELHRYSANDASLVAYQVWGGELRLVVAFVTFLFGAFFLLVYAKTRYALYLSAALCGMLFFPFFVAPADQLLALFKPETLLYLHYIGLVAMFAFFPFCQFFDRFYPKINWVLGSVMGLCCVTIASMAFHPNLDVFQHVRSLYFVGGLLSGLLSIYALARAVKAKREHSRLLLTCMIIFVASGINDMMLALGAIASISMIFNGAAIFLGAVLYVASNIFADTFVQNKSLVRDLQGMNDNLEGLVAERTLQLRQKTHDIESMLQNMPQGVLTVLADGSVHPEYSAYLETILETSQIGGARLMSLLFDGADLGSDALSQVEAALGSCIGEDQMNFEFNCHLLPAEFDKHLPDGRVKSLALTWSPICDDNDVIEKLMLCVRDVTELKRLSAEASKQRRELEIIGQVLAVSQEKFHEFVRMSHDFLARNKALVESHAERDDAVLQELFRNMHTIKGNARTYGLLHMTNVVHEAEQALDDLRSNRDAAWEPARLLADIAAVQAGVDEYARVNEHTLGRRGPGRRGGVERFLMVEKTQVAQSLRTIRGVDPTNAIAMREALREVGQTLSLIGTEPLGNILGGTIASLESLAKELGKEPPRVTIVDRGVRVRSQVAGTLRNVFTHVLRNAVDHGLEPAAERVARGKPAAGEIGIGLTLTDDVLRITVRDDGRGLALAGIRAKAVERGLIEAGATMSDAEVANLIFLSGFSTAEKLTEVSGRGVGMDAVKDFLKTEGGDVEIRFVDDAPAANGYRAFELVVRLPARFAMQTREWLQLADLPDFAHTSIEAA
jgi:HPt (histidine-containing phosphotransfer) domain-containing protein